MRIGNLEITIDSDVDIEDVAQLTLTELLTLGLKIKLGGQQVTIAKPIPNHPLQARRTVPARNRQTTPQFSEQVNLLRSAGFTDKTIVMVAGKILGIRTNGTYLEWEFGPIEEASKAFIHRKISEPIWALFVSTVTIPQLGSKNTCVIGLTEKNQLTILALEETKPSETLANLLKRGLDANKVKFGVLSDLGLSKDFRKTFSKAKIGGDWSQLLEDTKGGMEKFRIKHAMLAKDKKEVSVVVKDLDAPKEFLTYLDFPQKLWRVLKATTPINRLEKDLKSKLGSHRSEEEYNLILALALMRLQYHWDKIPADSEQLSHLKYMQD